MQVVVVGVSTWEQFTDALCVHVQMYNVRTHVHVCVCFTVYREWGGC